MEYTPFKAFAATISADLLNRGGVSATYYAAAAFAGPVKATVAATSATQKVQFKATAPAAGDYSIASLDAFSVRYAGQVVHLSFALKFEAPTMLKYLATLKVLLFF